MKVGNNIKLLAILIGSILLTIIMQVLFWLPHEPNSLSAIVGMLTGVSFMVGIIEWSTLIFMNTDKWKKNIGQMFPKYWKEGIYNAN